MLFFYCSSYINVLIDDPVTDVESFCGKKLASVSPLINLVFSPNSLKRLVFHILKVPCWLSDVHSIPQTFQFFLTDENVLDSVGNVTTRLTIVVEKIIDHGDGLDEHDT